MRKILLVAMLILSGCSSPQGLRNKAAALEGNTNKTPNEFSQCVSVKWNERYFAVQSLPRANGITLQLPGGIANIIAVLDVDKTSSGSVFTYHDSFSASNNLLRDVKDCQ